MHTVAEQRQPLDRFVAEHEADVVVGDLTAPPAHRRGGDLLLKQTIGDLDAIEPERGDVEEKRPACAPASLAVQPSRVAS